MSLRGAARGKAKGDEATSSRSQASEEVASLYKAAHNPLAMTKLFTGRFQLV